MSENFLLQRSFSHFFKTKQRQPTAQGLLRNLEPKKPEISHWKFGTPQIERTKCLCGKHVRREIGINEKSIVINEY